MQALRNAHIFARLVLVWFALSIGVAFASPIVSPKSFEMVCTGNGFVQISSDAEPGDANVSSHGMDCPLCMSVLAVGSVQHPEFGAQAPLSYALRPIAAAHIAWLTAAPMPPRGPPSTN